MYARVSFPISSFKIFTYFIPKSLSNKVRLGSCVNAPINKKIQTGFVISIQNNAGFDGRILAIDSIRDKELHLPAELWQTLDWVSKYYIAPLGQVLKSAVPNTYLSKYIPHKIQFVQIIKDNLNNVKEKHITGTSQNRIFSFLLEIDKPVKVSSLIALTASPYSVCKSLAKKGLVNILLQSKIDDIEKIKGTEGPRKITLTVEQNSVYKTIIKSKGSFLPFLLHGVTGSGKTEVYLKLAQYFVKNNKTVLVLVPEIALTPQVAYRFHNVFSGKTALWHSYMTPAEKGRTWQKLKKGGYSVVIGARSAIFAPLQNLGLIIIDEEQEFSYKQESPAPRYHARDVAIIRGKHANATVVLASATPSLESYYNALQKRFTLIKLTKRYGKSIYPSVEVVDMKHNNLKNNRSIISTTLINHIKDRLEKSEQIILLQNRRGYALIQRCKECGTITNCQRCAVAMTYHRTDDYLHCHHCESIEKISEICCNCSSDNLEHVGHGTQKIEELLNNQFPEACILRMDMDTVRKRGAHEKILRKFSNSEASILLGTQIIAKGLDFENVTLVGVINADTGLFFPDFRSGERVFQLIYQVAGRAGRRKKPGHAVIQTYNPDNIYIQTAASLNTSKFYNIAMAHRQELNYPPFSRIGRIIFSGPNKNKVDIIAQKTYMKLSGKSDYIILGPSPAPLEKIKDMWRSHLIIKTQNKQKGNIPQFIAKNINYSIFERSWKGVRIRVDIDPVSMM